MNIIYLHSSILFSIFLTLQFLKDKMLVSRCLWIIVLLLLTMLLENIDNTISFIVEKSAIYSIYILVYIYFRILLYRNFVLILMTFEFKFWIFIKFLNMISKANDVRCKKILFDFYRNHNFYRIFIPNFTKRFSIFRKRTVYFFCLESKMIL